MKKAAETILRCLEEKKISQRQLATCMGEDVRHLNQQLCRQNDMKVERFTDVLAHLGYRVEIVENDGIRKVSPDYAEKLIKDVSPKGLFWYETEDGYVGVDTEAENTVVKEFEDKEDCMKWLRGEV